MIRTPKSKSAPFQEWLGSLLSLVVTHSYAYEVSIHLVKWLIDIQINVSIRGVNIIFLAGEKRDAVSSEKVTSSDFRIHNYVNARGELKLMILPSLSRDILKRWVRT